MTSDEEHECCDERKIIWNQIGQACWQNPTPLNKNLSQVIRMSNKTPPS